LLMLSPETLAAAIERPRALHRIEAVVVSRRRAESKSLFLTDGIQREDSFGNACSADIYVRHVSALKEQNKDRQIGWK